jgi:tRNA-splicing ligase RtcB
MFKNNFINKTTIKKNKTSRKIKYQEKSYKKIKIKFINTQQFHIVMMEAKQISEFTWKIEKHGKMNVPALIYSSQALIEKVQSDKTMQQIANVACLPGIVKNAIAMPDAHEGYGFPIGGVAAFDVNEGIISPGGIGYDINCSVRLLRTDFNADQVMSKRKEFLEELYKTVPVGAGRNGIIKISKDQLNELLSKGARWAVNNGYGKDDDIERTEENGHLDADISFVSDKAIERGLPQLGTLGSGNHFLELQKVDKIYDEEKAKVFGITGEGQVVVMIHCGSRGLGHQVASDYIKKMEDKYGFENLPDRELINAPINSDLGREYLKAMGAAANFAFTNKQLITYHIRNAFEKIYGNKNNVDVVYDVCHNIGKFEKHQIDGETRNVCVHRKGATRSFGPGREEIPEIYRECGQPIIIPGSMGTASYLLVGTKTAEEVSFGSTAHGAGRVGSRSEALRTLRGIDIINQLKNKNIEVKVGSMKGIAEEAPQMYKNIDEVIRVSHGIGIGTMVARLVPLGVIKG